MTGSASIDAWYTASKLSDLESLELCFADRFHWGRERTARVIKQHVDTTEFVTGNLHNASGLVGIGDISNNRQGGTARISDLVNCLPASAPR